MPVYGGKTYTKKQVHQWREKFMKIDVEKDRNTPWKDRYIEADEVVQFVKREHDLDIDEEFVKELLAQVDTNGDGKISLGEFIEGYDELFKDLLEEDP